MKNMEKVMRILYPDRSPKEMVNALQKRKKKYVIYIVAIGVVLTILLALKEYTSSPILENQYIKRPTNLKNETLEITAQTEELGKFDLEITVPERILTKEEQNEIFKEIKNWLREVILGENCSLDKIQEPLNLPTEYLDTGIVIQWSSSNRSIVDEKGTVLNRYLNAPEIIRLKAKISYQNNIEEEDIEIQVLPKELSLNMKFRNLLEQQIEQNNQRDICKEQLELPLTVNQQALSYKEKKSYNILLVLILTVITAGVVYYALDQDTFKEVEQYKQKLLDQYPEFVSRLTLLIGAGLSVSGAIRKIYQDYKNAEGIELQPLAKELGLYIHALDNGVLEETALLQFANRVEVMEYRKFCSLIIQNTKRGSVSLKNLLEEVVIDALALKRQIVIRKGEKAATKLLFPMTIMLLIVMVLIMVPAFIKYQI